MIEADLCMQISPSEIQEIVMGLSGKPDKLYAEGLHVAGERYVLTKAEDRSLYARKVCYSFTKPVQIHMLEAARIPLSC